MLPHYSQGAYHHDRYIKELLSYDILLNSKIIYDEQSFKIEGLSTVNLARQYQAPWTLDMLDIQPSDRILEIGFEDSITKFVVAKHCEYILFAHQNADVLKQIEEQRKQMKALKLYLMQLEIHKPLKLTSNYFLEKVNKIYSNNFLNYLAVDDIFILLDSIVEHLPRKGKLVLSYLVALNESQSVTININISKVILERFGRFEPTQPQFAFALPDGTVCCQLCMVFDKP